MSVDNPLLAEDTNTYLVGRGGPNELLPSKNVSLPGLFEPYLDAINQVLDAMDDTNDYYQSFFDDLMPFIGLPNATSIDKVSGRWIIGDASALADNDLSLYFRGPELNSLTQYPYLLSAGDNVIRIGSPLDTWQSGTSNYYNDETGYLRQLNSGADAWFVALTPITINTTQQPPEKVSSGMTVGQIANSTVDYILKLGRQMSSQNVPELDTILDRMSQISMTADLWRADISGIGRYVVYIDSLNMDSIKASILSALDSFMPTNLLNNAAALLSGLNQMKNSLICLASCTINSIASAISTVAGTVGSLLSGDASKLPVQITLPDLDTLAKCFNLDWLINIVLSFLAKLLSKILGIWNLLKGLFSWPDCSCGAGGGGLKIGVDICGFGINTGKGMSNTAGHLGPLDSIQLSSSSSSSSDDSTDLSRKKADWNPGTALKNAGGSALKSVDSAVSKFGSIL